MCILCVIQRCSRKVATMLPWLVIPLIGLWALSQLLPPPFRFEITSPRIACVFVLLVTLFWYEILMPWLSAWRVRRNARLRERKRIEAIEMQRLRKTATRRCRNCLTPYRDQNPGAGKFMCSYCGHISKRPVLDLPVPPGMGASGKILNGKAWSDSGWMCGQDWLENGNWIGGPLAGKSSDWKNTNVFSEGTEDTVTDQSYSRIFIFSCRAITLFIFRIMWFWRKLFRVGSSEEDVSDAERREMLDKQGETGGNGQESRGERARRKAEEKRQARLEKELLEEEERMQREEVARLVEEQRRLRDEKMEAEKEQGKDSPCGKEIGSKREAEKKRQEKKKERDRWSSKSNSDAEESEKRAGEHHRSSPESMKAYSTEVGHVYKGASAFSQNKGNTGTRYFDRMRGTLLSSSRAFTGGGFFGKSTNSTNVSNRPNILVDHAQTSTYRKDSVQPNFVHGRLSVNGDEKSVNHPVSLEPKPCTAPKRSWQQLFACSSAVPPPFNSNVIGRPNGKYQAELQSPPISNENISKELYDKPFNFGLPSPSISPPFTIGSISTSSGLPLSSETVFPRIGDASVKIKPEESEIFEDPCYDPDPISLIGHDVYGSISNSPLDVGFISDLGLKTPPYVKTVAAPSEVTKPSPIESPWSRSRVFEERHASSFLFHRDPKAQDNSNNVTETGTWQMWSSCPLGQDSLGFGNGPVSWLLPPEMKKEDIVRPVPHKTVASLFKNDEKFISGTLSPQQSTMLGNYQTDGEFNNSMHASVDDPWLPKTPFGQASGNDNQILLKSEEAARRGLRYGNSNIYASNDQFEMSASNSWAKKEWSDQDSRNGFGNSPISRPHIGGLLSPPDVQSLWSYE